MRTRSLTHPTDATRHALLQQAIEALVDAELTRARQRIRRGLARILQAAGLAVTSAPHTRRDPYGLDDATTIALDDAPTDADPLCADLDVLPPEMAAVLDAPWPPDRPPTPGASTRRRRTR
jgi:hypothetical protein